MSTVSEPIVAQPGTELTFGEALLGALRHLKRLWLGAIGYAILLGLTILGIAAAVQLGVVLVVWVDLPPVVTTVMQLAANLLIGVLSYSLIQGYLWAVIRSYDRGRFIWGEVFQGWRKRWRWRLWGLGLAIVAVYAGAEFLDAMFIGPGLANLPLPPMALQALSNFVSPVTQATGIAIHVLTLLAGPILLASTRPRVFRAVRENLQILRNQPKRYLPVVLMSFAPVVPPLLVAVPMMLAGSAASDQILLVFLLAMASLVACGILWIVYMFILAGFYRSVYGLPLEPTLGRVTAFHGVISGAIRPGSIVPARVRRRREEDFDPGAFLPAEGDGAEAAADPFEAIEDTQGAGPGDEQHSPAAEPDEKRGP